MCNSSASIGWIRRRTFAPPGATFSLKSQKSFILEINESALGELPVPSVQGYPKQIALQFRLGEEVYRRIGPGRDQIMLDLSGAR